MNFLDRTCESLMVNYDDDLWWEGVSPSSNSPAEFVTEFPALLQG